MIQFVPTRSPTFTGRKTARFCGRDHQHLVHRLHLHDRGLRNQQRAFGHAGLNTHASEAAGTQNRIGIGKLRRHLDGPRLGADLAVDVDDLALSRETADR